MTKILLVTLVLVGGLYCSGTNDDPALPQVNINATLDNSLVLLRAGHYNNGTFSNLGDMLKSATTGYRKRCYDYWLQVNG